ncbi:MAG: NapC/NirT family cytochrome c [candidate division Zixibacteria bacterium]|nr:NapC/NirT family cytochrome c [candidate division Zixibacteria bacterium]
MTVPRPRLPRLAYNWISSFGAFIALATALVIIVMLLISFTMEQTSAYFGIFLYMVLPAILICGLILIPIGMFREWRRWKRGESSELPRWPLVDLNNPRHRNATAIFVVGTVLFFAISAVGSYQAYHYSESVKFCGTTCHTVMEPQYTAYQASPHARVACVECHVGTGASWYAKSKLSGAYQVYAVMANVYPRPIATPIRNLRPARETCEECHWPEKTYGQELRTFTHYMYDEDNPKWSIDMRIITDTGEPHAGQKAGIHWHINPDIKIEYIARDYGRQDIPWVRVTEKSTGAVTLYEDEANPLDPAARDTLAVRVMDCIDCHNRPSHIYRSPDYAVDRSLQAGFIDPTLPGIKALAVEAMAAEYDTKDAALSAISTRINDHYKEAGLLDDPARHSAVDSAIVAVQHAFTQNIFPYMKARWDVYPNNIGHFNDIGCMRCHAGNHKSSAGAAITHDCSACHTIVTQGPAGAMERDSTGLGLEFKHPVDIDDAWKETGCYECHAGVQP